MKIERTAEAAMGWPTTNAMRTNRIADMMSERLKALCQVGAAVFRSSAFRRACARAWSRFWGRLLDCRLIDPPWVPLCFFLRLFLV